MNLEQYQRPRLLIQSSDTPVYDAVRAMESNRVGYVIVQDQRRVVGVLTDRDVALRVVGKKLDPETTRLEDVMTEAPATLALDASEADAVTLMRDCHIRRVPVVEDGKAVGVVTMDDLIMAQAAAPEALAEVVRAQLNEPAELKPEGSPEPTAPARAPRPSTAAERRAAHARQTAARAARLIQSKTGIDTAEHAIEALRVVVGGIVRRLTPAEASDLLAQLPSELRESWLDLEAGPDRSITRESIALDLGRVLGVDRGRADTLLAGIGECLSDWVSSGEIEHVRSQLPQNLREILSPET